MKTAREVIAECCDGPMMETALEDADSILFALKEAGYVVVQDYPYRNLWTGEICDENSTQKHPTLSPPDPTAG